MRGWSERTWKTLDLVVSRGDVWLVSWDGLYTLGGVWPLVELGALGALCPLGELGELGALCPLRALSFTGIV